jgi:hypothetical protein
LAFDKFGYPCDSNGISIITEAMQYKPSPLADRDPWNAWHCSLSKASDIPLHVFLAQKAMRSIERRAHERDIEEPELARTRQASCRDVNRATGLKALRQPATVDMQLQLLASPIVADNSDFVCLQYQEEDIITRVISAALEARGYDSAHAPLISDMVQWLTEH